MSGLFVRKGPFPHPHPKSFLLWVSAAVVSIYCLLLQVPAYAQGQKPEDELKNLFINEIVAETCLAKIVPMDNPEAEQFGRRLVKRYEFLGPVSIMAVTGYAVSQQKSIEQNINKGVCKSVFPQAIAAYNEVGLSGDAFKQALKLFDDAEDMPAVRNDADLMKEVLLTDLISDICVQKFAGLTNPESRGYTEKMLALLMGMDSEAFEEANMELLENAEKIEASIDTAACKKYLPQGIANYREAGFSGDALKKALGKIQTGSDGTPGNGETRKFSGEALLKREAGMFFWYLADNDENEIVFIGSPAEVKAQNKNLAECLEDASDSGSIVEIKGKWLIKGADGLEGLDIPSVMCRRIK